MRSGSTCVLPCTRGSCALGNYCAASGLCLAGCETSAACGLTSVCNTTTHACVTTIVPQFSGSQCPTGYTGGTICYATNQFACRYSGETYVMAGSSQGTNTCPTGTTQHGSFDCPANGPSPGYFQIYCVTN